MLVWLGKAFLSKAAVDGCKLEMLPPDCASVKLQHHTQWNSPEALRVASCSPHVQEAQAHHRGSARHLIQMLIMQEGALTALASVADAANAHFIRYYDTVMPMLKNILYSSASKVEQLLRAKALECVSLVGMAVGKERFRADAQEVMAFMQQLQVAAGSQM